MRLLRVIPVPLMIAIAQFVVTAPPVLAGSVVYLPAAANNVGLFGSQFRTRVSIFVSSPARPIILNVAAATPAGLLPPTSVVIPDYAGSYSSENILEDLFHYAGAAALSFTLDPLSSPATFIVRAEVYTDGPCGEMSTSVPVLTSEYAIPPPVNPTFGQYNTSQSIGVRSDSEHRVNVACSNFSSNPVSVDAYIYTGSVLEGYHRFPLSPGQWSQAAVDRTWTPDGSGPPVLSDGIVRFSAFPAQGLPVAANIGPVFCYAVVVVNASNDGTLVPGAPGAAYLIR